MAKILLDYSGVPPEAINAVQQVVDDLLKKAPELQNYLSRGALFDLGAFFFGCGIEYAKTGKVRRMSEMTGSRIVGGN